MSDWAHDYWLIAYLVQIARYVVFPKIIFLAFLLHFDSTERQERERMTRSKESWVGFKPGSASGWTVALFMRYGLLLCAIRTFTPQQE